jgi:hypothetical protein
MLTQLMLVLLFELLFLRLELLMENLLLQLLLLFQLKQMCLKLSLAVESSPNNWLKKPTSKFIQKNQSVKLKRTP